MPKIVDHDKQRLLVAEAAWRVIRRDGMEQASVRKIAEEAGISPGSMRHYFSTQSELLLYAMTLVSKRVHERIKRLDLNGPPLENAKRLLLEVLPTTEENMAEMEVWYAFTAKSKTDPALKSLADQVYGELRYTASSVIQYLIKLGLAKPDMQEQLETERLYALIDGLAVHAILNPEQMEPQLLEDIVELHLSSLCSKT
ncbi:TetR/AcrR family transcriptional regulator [Paenibacillus sp. FSL W8-0426]|uniref:TetR/AcrR family transcriptional regulator n=1 Tax=Paenibacillus sp. FSL W8-0426 TaxID=2921714 RepID=UPI0030D92A65